MGTPNIICLHFFRARENYGAIVAINICLHLLALGYHWNHRGVVAILKMQLRSIPIAISKFAKRSIYIARDFGFRDLRI